MANEFEKRQTNPVEVTEVPVKIDAPEDWTVGDLADEPRIDVEMLDEEAAEGRASEILDHFSGNATTHIQGREEAEALSRYHLATAAGALQVASSKAAEEPGAIAGAGLRSLADAVSTRLYRSADLIEVFEIDR